MPASKKRDLYKDIRTLHLVRWVLYLAGAAALIAMLRGVSIPVNTIYITRDTLTSVPQTLFVPALRNVFDAPVAYMAAVAFIISGGIGLYRYTKGEEAYKKSLKKGSDKLKWIDLALSSAIFIEIVALFAGVSDPSIVKVSAGLVIVTCALGWLADRQNLAAKKPDWSAFAISVATGLLPWLVIGSSLALTTIYGAVRLPWYCYALAGSLFVCFTALAVNQKLNIDQHKQWKNYAFTERTYLAIDLVTKIAFAVILIVGLRG
jgi:hypothetical protein